MRKVLAILMIPALLICMWSAATADGEFVFDTHAANQLKEYTGPGGDIVIPEAVDGQTVRRIKNGAFSEAREAVTGIEFPETLQLIEIGVLNSMPNLAKADLPSGLQVLGPNNFLSCPGVTEIVVPPTVYYIGSGCFSCPDGDISVTFTGPVPIMPEDFSLWNTETSVIYVPDDLYDEYRAVIYEGQRVEKSGKNAVIPEYFTPESDFEFDTATGTITRYLADAVRIDIPAEIGGTPVRAIGDSAFKNANPFYVSIPEGVETIGESAFEECYNLTVLRLPDSLKSIGAGAFKRTDLYNNVEWGNGLETIGDEAFYLSSVGPTVVFPEPLREIGREAFYSTRAHDVYFGKNIREIGEKAFSQALVNYIYFDNEELPEIALDAFEDNRSTLEDIDLPMNASRAAAEKAKAFFEQINPDVVVWRANPEDVEYPSGRNGYEFRDDGTYMMTTYSGDQTALTTYWTYQMDDGTIVNITGIGDGVFKGNQSLKLFRVNRSEFFSYIGAEAFADSALEEIDLFDTVTTLKEGALRNCKALKELTLPESLTEIGEGALEGLTGLESVTVKCDAGLLPENVFAGLPNLRSVTVEKGAIPAGFAEGSPVEDLVLGEEVTAIGDRAFAGTSVKNLIVPNIRLGADCFAGVSSAGLTAAADTPDEQMAALAAMTGAPWYRPILREGEKSSFLIMPDEPNEEGDFLFNKETGTVELYTGQSERVVIPRSIDGVEVRAISGQFGDRARDYTGTEIINNQNEWTHVRELVIPETVTEIGDSAFSYWQQLETVICYAPLETTGRATFQMNTNLKTAVFMNRIKAIDNYCFDHCPALKTVWWPEGTLDYIGVQAFSNCVFETFIADAKEIREVAFRDCAGLESAHIRGSIAKMELSAFSGCTSLHEICIETMDDEVFTGANGYSGACGGDTKLIIPAETDDKHAKYLLRMWHTSNFGPVPDEDHVIRADCAMPEYPQRPDVTAFGFAAPEE